jgi:hypothetical protein
VLGESAYLCMDCLARWRLDDEGAGVSHWMLRWADDPGAWPPPFVEMPKRH